MKKRYYAVLALAAALSLGNAGISAMAAAGWAQEGNTWVYYNSSGSRVTNAWRQGADGYWRYLNSSGVMAVDSWVDNDDYYVDASGIMISGKWLQVTNTNTDKGYDYYYFNQNGKNVKNKWEQIDNKWYHFGDAGAMETGWLLDNMYYCDPNGVMLTGWQKLDPPDEYASTKDHLGPFETASDDMCWYYFTTSGKKVVPDENSNYDNIKQKKINGVYYCLRDDGAMQVGWVCVTGDDSDTIEDYRYVDNNGQVRVGWYSVEPPEDLMSNYEHDVEWFYFNNRGVPKVGPAKGAAKTSDLVKINGNTYLFDDAGVPVYGLQKVYTNSDESEYTAYYFGNRQQSSMLKGKFNIDDSGTSRAYYFSSTGKGYTGVYDNYLYYMGKLQKASSGSKYEVFTIYTSNGNPKNYVINTSGHIAKNTTVKDNDGVKYKTNSGGVLVKEDGEDPDGGVYLSPEEPDWDLGQD